MVNADEQQKARPPEMMRAGVVRAKRVAWLGLISVSPRSSTFVNLLGAPVEMRCRADPVGLALEGGTVGKLRVFQVLDRGKVAVD